MFEKTYVVGWEHTDFNGHMGNTSYLDLSASTRLAYFESCGFAIRDFRKNGIGPVIRRDMVNYFREVDLLEEIRVTVEVSGLSNDASRFRIVNNFFKTGGVMSASVTSLGGWLDLKSRKLAPPPAELAVAMRNLDRTEEFEILDSSIK